MLKFLTIGLFQGAVYGLLAVGLVMVYKGTRAFNFAQGEFGTVAVFATWALVEKSGVPYPLAILAGLAVALVIGLIVERLVIRPLLNASRVAVLVATVGVAFLLIALEILFFKAEPQVLRPIIKGDALIIFGAGIPPQQILAVVVLGALAVGLALFFKTNRGLAVLAISQDPLATRVVGVSVPGMSRFIWGFAALLGAVAGLLQAPIGIFTPGFMTTITLVPAFVGAVLGGMTSLPGAFVGGLIVGVAENLGIFYLGQGLGVPGSGALTVFVVLMAVLLARPQGLLGTEA